MTLKLKKIELEGKPLLVIKGIYIYAMSRVGLHNYALMLSNVIREGIRNFFSNCVKEVSALYNQSVEVLLSKRGFNQKSAVGIDCA